MSQKQRIQLHDGNQIPLVGFGTYKLTNGEESYQMIRLALELGYRHLDTAAMYQNEETVGKAVRESGIPREEIFVTTKLHPDDQGYTSCFTAFETSLKKLGLDYVDLYMIHWPGKDRYVETWKAMEELKASGKVKSIGVCNFQEHHLETLRKESTLLPVINQVERHPFFAQNELHRYLDSQDIKLAAWSPLMRGSEQMSHDSLQRISQKHGKSVAQIVLRWHLETGALPLPKSSNPQRMKENLDIFDFQLDDEDLHQIALLDTDARMGRHPDDFLF